MQLEAIKQLRDRIIRPTLESINSWSPVAEALLLGTAAQESHFKYYVQLGGGPALGIYQMEPATFRDIWDNYLKYRPVLNARARMWAHTSNVPGATRPDPEEMVWNLRFATVMCRMHYMRVPSPLPEKISPVQLGRYWKQFYNTPLGKGTVDEFAKNWHRFELSKVVKEDV